MSAQKQSSLRSSTDVLIIGAGPTGMALAIALQKAGIDYLLVDKLPQGLNTSRAGVVHAHTLEVLDQLGVAQELARNGLRVTHFSIRDRDRALLQLDFAKLPSDHPYLLMIPQDETERILRERLAALGGTIHRGVAATEVEQDRDCATVRLDTPGGPATVQAKFVVGADGLHSLVREAAETEFEGGSYEDSFVLADVRMDWAFESKEVCLFFSPAGFLVVSPLPNGSFRVVATSAQAIDKPDCRYVQALLDSRGPRVARSRVREVLWSSRFRLQHRVAKRYFNGRLILMGDAAHVHSPAGGQGMNTGLVDAVVLGQLLPEALGGGDPAVLFGRYQQLRQPAAVKVVALAGWLTDLATTKGLLRRTVRNSMLSLLNILPPARRRLLGNLSGISRRQHAEVFPLPHPVLGRAHETAL